MDAKKAFEEATKETWDALIAENADLKARIDALTSYDEQFYVADLKKKNVALREELASMTANAEKERLDAAALRQRVQDMKQTLLNLVADNKEQESTIDKFEERIKRLEEAGESVVNTYEYYRGYKEPVATMEVLRQLARKVQAALEDTDDDENAE